MNDPMNTLIFALDFGDLPTAINAAERFKKAGGKWVKIGPVLFFKYGVMTVMKAIRKTGLKVFADPKLCNTDDVLKATAEVFAEHPADMLNCMADSGKKALPGFADTCREVNTMSLAVTVLTTKDKIVSLEQYRRLPTTQVVKLAMDWVRPAMLDGIVCSAQEARVLRARGYNGKLVTPGIRFLNTAAGDQKRIMTPSAALAGGSDYNVMGSVFKSDPESNVPRYRDEVGEYFETGRIVA